MKIKLIAVLTILYSIMGFNVSSADASGTCSEVTSAVAERYEEQNDKATEVFEEMVTVPDKEQLKGCLDGIKVLDTYSIGLPSVTDWFGQFCEFVNDQVGDQLSTYQKKLKYEPLPGFSAGAPGIVTTPSSTSGVSHTGDVRIKTNSAAKAKSILERIRE